VGSMGGTSLSGAVFPQVMRKAHARTVMISKAVSDHAVCTSAGRIRR
jgi:hypothetical protein